MFDGSCDELIEATQFTSLPDVRFSDESLLALVSRHLYIDMGQYKGSE